MLKQVLKFATQLVLFTTFLAANAGIYEDFFRAIEIDDARAVRAALQRGFDPNTPDERGQVGLFLAMRGGSFQAAGLLLAHPELKIDATNAHGETPLMMAALRGHFDWVQRMLQRGAQVNRDGWTPLQYAASGPSAATVRLLLDGGASIDARSPRGSTALMLAAQYGSEDAVRLLLERGADVRLQDERGATAADYARRAGRDTLATSLEPAR